MGGPGRATWGGCLLARPSDLAMRAGACMKPALGGDVLFRDLCVPLLARPHLGYMDGTRVQGNQGISWELMGIHAALNHATLTYMRPSSRFLLYIVDATVSPTK